MRSAVRPFLSAAYVWLVHSDTSSVLHASTPVFFLLLKSLGDHYVSQPNCLDINRPIKLKMTARKLFFFLLRQNCLRKTELVTNIRQRQNTNLFNKKTKVTIVNKKTEKGFV